MSRQKSTEILISGCSFTHWPEQPGSEKNICWPAHLSGIDDGINITNLAEPGAGNQYIADSVIRAVCEQPDRFDIVLVMWSGVSRLDFLTDLSDPTWHAMFDSYGFYRRLPACPNKLGYIFSGGFLGPWAQNDATRSIFKNLYRVSDRTSLAHINLIEIIKTQQFLAAKKIPHLFMSYVNYWVKDQGYVSPNGDFGVMAMPELQPLVSAIDFSSWLFADDQRQCIYDLAKQRDDFHGDRFHPGIDTHRIWADLVKQRIRPWLK